jgi:hypothetical protein
MNEYVLLATRWLARGVSVVVAGGFLLLVIGEFTHPHSGPPTQLREWAGIAMISLGVAGMLLAWKYELAGALLSIAALSAFAFVVRMNRYDVVALLALPGVLFLLDWMLRRSHQPAAN